MSVNVTGLFPPGLAAGYDPFPDNTRNSRDFRARTTVMIQPAEVDHAETGLSLCKGEYLSKSLFQEERSVVIVGIF
ncbi:hypothetical protein BIW11_03094 [Tropilaelaps mercedesae]|uniref:Uncharacterized protein n=1 Tax=Tropilaelaps mercedesae TaxID=418985 RepID=A0A1V9XS60_9ACAR|nr:hypothetical protein BIW11_03094 [Tropilaelaps mercedesae]